MHNKASSNMEISPAKINLLTMTRAQLTEHLKSLGHPAFRAKQIWNWMYHYGVNSFDDMSNISKEFRKFLNENYYLGRPEITTNLKSVDGTRKWLLKFDDGNEVETVHIPDAGRGSLCVSSQVGCTLNCKFCHTGTQKMVRNLTAAEIVSQMMLARDQLDDWKNDNESKKTSNIVMMGMGEPLLNYDNVAEAIKIFLDPDGINLSKRKITLSTSGIVPAIEKCGNDLGVNLAISLHAVNDKLRDILVPINKKYPIAELLKACEEYPAASNSRRITFEYVMLKDVNDSDDDARQLIKLLENIHAKINLIPFNPWPGSVFECSSNNRIRRFADVLLEAGYSSPIRTPRGQDILAACGQLKSTSTKERASASK
ncbi:23S rRNA (adenine(2503)-C(2))-methyltransferase RlmN [Rickettsiales bacterium]|nr:23S rRNA (adenine(2503)-C(2))-methyltransferase RlmN [Rickettsiales bacterium]